MAYNDIEIQQLRVAAPLPSEPEDFDAFWAQTMTEARSFGTAMSYVPIETGIRLVQTYDVRFAGFSGQPVAAWLHLPPHADRIPAVVQYVGYGRGRGLPHEMMTWAMAGHAHLVVDARGQGSIIDVGDTADPLTSDGEAAPAYPGFLTRGIQNPESYYYRRLFVDAARAVDALATHPSVDADDITVAGASQGASQAIAAAALSTGVARAMLDVPFLSNIARAITLTDSHPYAEIVGYLSAHRDQVEVALRTLSYVDVASLAKRAHQASLFSVALLDSICPPSTVYAAYHAWQGRKSIVEYPFNDHEGGGAHHVRAQIDWLQREQSNSPRERISHDALSPPVGAAGSSQVQQD